MITDCGLIDPISLCVARNWVNRETTPDQQNIENVLGMFVAPDDQWLHIGVGNSSLAKRFHYDVERIDGISISDEEIEHANGLGIRNYKTWICNKYSPNFKPSHYDLIIDNNPSSHCCCMKHLLDYLNTIHNSIGVYITDKIGLEHAESYAQGFTLYQFQDLIEPMHMTIEPLTTTVYVIRNKEGV